MKTYHNIYFNGRTSYADGLEAIQRANTDDYSSFINLYPVSNHKAAESAKSQMDQTIEKCRKCIKLHSIHVRPKYNSKKSRDPGYKQWLESKEFNKQMWRAWMLLGQAEFHKGEFLESVGTFNYVSRLYPNDKNIVALCQLWVVRAYGELGWIYEAEDMLSKVVVDDISRKDLPFYSAVSADIAMKGEHYREAIAFVKVAREAENKKQYRPRFEFVLGELYEHDHQNAAACAAYKRVNKMHSKDVELDFNAKIRAAELSSDTAHSLHQLRRLARLYKYRDKQDQLYNAIGNIYLSHKDTIQALAAYEKAIRESTQNGSHKAAALLTAGDLYYQCKKYTPAAPCYTELVQILDHEHPAYPVVEKRSSILEDLVAQTQTIELQDSLQYLASLTEEEQLVIVQGIIERLIEQEKQDSLQAAQNARNNELAQAGGGLKSVNTLNMLGGGGGDQNWYFYNAQLMKNGKQEFLRKWGNRPLEDNWRRKSKAAISTFQQPQDEETEGIEDTTALSMLDEQQREQMEEDAPVAQEMDPHQPQYYLQQIPRTDEDFATSNTLIADALYTLVGIYRDKAEDIPMSQATFAEFQRRFPQDERQLNLYYMQYLSSTKMEDSLMIDSCRNAIIHRYPESQEAAIVGNPDYAPMMRQMLREQDSLYQDTYTAYTHGQFDQVKTNKRYVEQTYPLSTLMPRFLFLNAIAVAKTQGQDGFVTELRDMVDRYPTSELGAIAKDMLAMMGQGMESQQDGSASTLADKRGVVEEEQDTIPSDLHFSSERQERSLVVIVLPQGEELVNGMLYEMALFNFTQFLIKDFDIITLPIFLVNQSAIQISGFDSLDEAQWYISLVEKDNELVQKISAIQGQIIGITEPNYQLLGNPFTIEDYLGQ